MIGERSEYARGRREPGVEDIGVDDGATLFESIEFFADSFEECAAVKTGSRLEKREMETPVELLLNAPEHGTEIGSFGPQVLGCGVQ
jgi:hypothetical protein